MKHFRLVALLGLFTICLGLQAQMIEPIKWKTSAKMTSAKEGEIRFDVTIDPGWHLYGLSMPSTIEYAPDPTSVTINTNPAIELVGALTPSVPVGMHYDSMFEEEIPFWTDNFHFIQKFKLVGGAKGANISGKITFQGCNDSSCIPPQKVNFNVTVGDPNAKEEVAPATAAAASADADKKDDKAAATQAEAVVEEAEQTEGEDGAVAQETVEVAEGAAIPSVASNADLGTIPTANPSWWAPVEAVAEKDTDSSSWWELLIWGFIGGLAALMTPCVWPMIPMTMSFFLKKSKNNRKKSIFDAVSYGLSIIVIFLALGLAITAIFGAGKLNDLATSALFNLIFFAILVIFAISFFGAFNITLPSSWSNKIDSKAESTTGLLSIFFMAFTLVLVSFSCTGPIIGTLLVEAAASGSISGPAWGMGGFALGLALPFGLFAFFPSMIQSMPKSGGWLNSVKVVLGFLELILSLKFLSVADLAYGWRILDREVFLALWIVLFALLGMYLLGKLRFPHDDIQEKTGVFPFFLALISFSFALYMLPGLWGAPLKSISAFAPPLYTQDFSLYRADVHEFDDYEEGMRYAKENNLPVLVDFSGFACVNCRKMEGAVFDNNEVRDIVENDYVFIKLMVDDKAKLPTALTATENGNEIDIETVGEKWSFLQRYKFSTNSQPYYVILDNEGNSLVNPRAYDEDVNAFIGWLNQGKEEYSK